MKGKTKGRSYPRKIIQWRLDCWCQCVGCQAPRGCCAALPFDASLARVNKRTILLSLLLQRNLGSNDRAWVTSKITFAVVSPRHCGKIMDGLAARIVGVLLVVSGKSLSLLATCGWMAYSHRVVSFTAKALNTTPVEPEMNTTDMPTTTLVAVACNLTDPCTLGFYCGRLYDDDDYAESGLCYGTHHVRENICRSNPNICFSMNINRLWQRLSNCW